MTDKTKIKEIFASVQGEGKLVGYKQLFIRFCGCNLQCQYCDTEFDAKDSKEYNIPELLAIIRQYSDCHSISLTGGEPLLNKDFLKEFLPQCPLPVYLETNATLTEELKEVIDYIDFVSADIKLKSCTNDRDLFKEHDKFFSVASKKELFAKIVFDANIKDDEIINCCNLGNKYDIELILQPMMIGNKPSIEKEFIVTVQNKFLENYPKVRLIPQVHKYLDIQ